MIPNFKPQLIKRRSGPPPVKPVPGSRSAPNASTRPSNVAPPGNRFKLSAPSKSRTASPAAHTEPSTRYLSPPRSRVQNRKRKVSPSAAIQWGSDSDDDSESDYDSDDSVAEMIEGNAVFVDSASTSS